MAGVAEAVLFTLLNPMEPRMILGEPEALPSGFPNRCEPESGPDLLAALNAG